MQLVGCQYDIAWEDASSNYRKVEEMLARETIEQGSLIALPEMFSSGFSMNVERVAEASPSQSEAFLSMLAKRHESWTVGGLVYKQESGRGRNELAIFDPSGDLAGRYRKNYGFGTEPDHYDASDEITIFEWQGFRVCPLICYDLRFPELFRRGAQQGADLFVVIACWPEVRAEHWKTLLKARAIENQAIVMGVNRIGEDPAWRYGGNSMIVDEQGNTLAEAQKEESCISASITLEQVRNWRESFPALKDMKP